MSFDEPQALSVKRFCELHAIGRTTFYEEVKSGRLKARKVGNKTLILREDADDWRSALPTAPPRSPEAEEAEPSRYSRRAG